LSEADVHGKPAAEAQQEEKCENYQQDDEGDGCGQGNHVESTPPQVHHLQQQPIQVHHQYRYAIYKAAARGTTSNPPHHRYTIYNANQYRYVINTGTPSTTAINTGTSSIQVRHLQQQPIQVRHQYRYAIFNANQYKFNKNPATMYGGITSCKVSVNVETPDGQPDGIMPPVTYHWQRRHINHRGSNE